VNNGEVSASPPKVVPAGAPTVDRAGAAGIPRDAPPWILKLLQQNPWIPLAVLIVAILLALLLTLLIPIPGAVFGLLFVLAGIYAYRTLRAWQVAEQAAG